MDPKQSGKKHLSALICGFLVALPGALSARALAQAQDDQSTNTQSNAAATDKLPAAPDQSAAQANSQPSVSSGSQPPNQPLPVSPSPQLPFGGMKHQLDREEHSEVTLAKTPRNIVWDWAHITVGPLYLRTGDLRWLLPLAGASAVAFATDTHTMTQVVSSNPSFNNLNNNISDGFRDGFIAVPAAMAAIGIARNDERVRETGLLGSEAVLDAFGMDEIVKLCTFRERPLVDNGKGEFYVGSAGINSSFVSGHSMVSWASAAVLAGEYHNKWVQTGIYTASTGVSLERVLAQKHFPTDVLIGAAGGWLIGHYVYRAHHHRVLHPEVDLNEPLRRRSSTHLVASTVNSSSAQPSDF